MDLAHACSCSSGDISQLTDAELIALVDVVGARLGEEILKQGEREDAVARTLARDLTETYEADLFDAVEAELSQVPEAEFDPEMVPALMGGVSRRLGSPSDLGMDRAIATATATLMLIGRRRARAGVGADRVRDVPASPTDRDVTISATVARLQTFWVGDLWDVHLSGRVQQTVARESLRRGLGRVEVGRIVRGTVTGEFPAVAVPGTWRGSVEQYFTALTGTVRTQASNLGALHAMADAGSETYEWLSTIDQRTSEICRFMNGRRWSVRSALSLEDRMFRAEDPDEFKRIAGWRTLPELQRIAGGGSAEDQAALLGAAGVQVPPAHGGPCRSIIVSV